MFLFPSASHQEAYDWLPLIGDATFGILAKMAHVPLCGHIYRTATVFTLWETKYHATLNSAQQEAVAFPGSVEGKRSPHTHPTARPHLFSTKITSQNQRVPTPTHPDLFPSLGVRLRSESPGSSFVEPDRWFLLYGAWALIELFSPRGSITVLKRAPAGRPGAEQCPVPNVRGFPGGSP